MTYVAQVFGVVGKVTRVRRLHVDGEAEDRVKGGVDVEGKLLDLEGDDAVL